jgi:glycosyltransferase involved in cell wall biosynthesis
LELRALMLQRPIATLPGPREPVRILHLSSDWKWTGPSAPLLELALAQRAQGHEVDLACPRMPPHEVDGLWLRAEQAGLVPALELERGRGVIWWRDTRDARRLAALVAGRRYDVLHAWHTRDHLLAYRAAAIPRAAGTCCVVRSHPDAAPLPRSPWSRWLYRSATDGLWCVSPETARRNAGRCGTAPVRGGFGAVDLERFRPGAAPAALRAAFGIGAGDLALGIAARVQRHRRFELLIDAFARLVRREPRARLVVIGRGTRFDDALRRPAERRGVLERVHFAGYRRADYADALRCLDVFTLLVPGSDGSCRALLEAQATGLPAVVTRRGALPEIVDADRTGLVADETPDALAGAYHALLSSPERRRAMSAAARARAEALFAPARRAAEVDAHYRAAHARAANSIAAPRGTGVA